MVLKVIGRHAAKRVVEDPIGTHGIETAPSGCIPFADGGIEVKAIHEQYGETYIRCISNAWHGRHRYHNIKVFYTNPRIKEPRAYVSINGKRYYLNECLRT